MNKPEIRIVWCHARISHAVENKEETLFEKLVSCKVELVSCKVELVSCKVELVSRKVELVSCKVKLVSCKVKLVSCKVKLVSCKVKVVSCKVKLVSSNYRFDPQYKKKDKIRIMVSSNYNYETAYARNSSCTLHKTIYLKPVPAVRVPCVQPHTAYVMWWHTRRNQISSFGETDESI